MTSWVSACPPGAVHHGGGDVVRCDERVERRGAGLRAVGFVEAAVVDRSLAVADVDVRGLRERRETFVGGVRRKHGGPIRRMVGRIASHRVTVAIHRIESRVAVPGFVEVNAIDALREQRLGLDGVVAHAVIGAVRQHRVDGVLVRGVLGERVVRDRFRDRLGFQPRRRDQANDPVVIAGGTEEDGNPAGEDQGLLDRLVAVAVAQGDLGVADAGRHDRAVRSGRAVEDRIRAVGAEHAGRISFAFADGPGVAEQGAEGSAFNPHVGAEDVLAVVVEEHPPDGRLEERDAALVTRGRRRVFTVAVVTRQRGGKGREQGFKIALHRGEDATGDEGGGVVEEPDELVGERRHLHRDRAGQLPIGHQKDGHSRVTASQRAKQLGGLSVGVLFVLPDGPVQEHAVDPGVGRHGCQPIFHRKSFKDLDPAGAELRRQPDHCSPTRRGRPAEFVIDYQNAPQQFGSRDLGHGMSSRPALGNPWCRTLGTVPRIPGIPVVPATLPTVGAFLLGVFDMDQTTLYHMV